MACETRGLLEERVPPTDQKHSYLVTFSSEVLVTRIDSKISLNLGDSFEAKQILRRYGQGRSFRITILITINSLALEKGLFHNPLKIDFIHSDL